MATAAKLDDKGLIVTCPSCQQQNRLAFDHLGDEVRCGRCKTALASPAAPLEIGSTADFDRLIANSALPVLVDFWAPWCGPCRMVAPELEKVATRQAGRLLVVKVNTDVLGEVGAKFGVRSIPTLIVFSGGREAGRTAGARPAADIEAFAAGASRQHA